MAGINSSRRAAERAEEYAYQYDDIGNRLSSLDLGTNRTYVANSLNQYTLVGRAVPSAPQEEFAPQFDLDGNQTLIQTATGIWSVTYNGENRPVLWTCGVTNIVMSFDRMGRRVEYIETVSDNAGGPGAVPAATNTHHRFVYDGYLCIQRLNAASNNAIDLVFGWDPSEQVATRPLILQKYGAYSLFYTHDGNKNVSELVFFQQANGIAAHYEYAPFGAVTATTRSTPVMAYDFREYNPFRFSSEYADAALALVYYNYRHYEPVIGRWLRRDVLLERGGPNLYRFIDNACTDGSDLLGLADDSCLTPGSQSDFEMVITARRRGHPKGSDPDAQKAADELLSALKKLGYVSGIAGVATGGGIVGAINAAIDYFASQNMAPGTGEFKHEFENLLSSIGSVLIQEPLTLVGYVEYKICDCVDGRLKFVARRYPDSDDFELDLPADANPLLSGGDVLLYNDMLNEFSQRLFAEYRDAYKDEATSIRQRAGGAK